MLFDVAVCGRLIVREAAENGLDDEVESESKEGERRFRVCPVKQGNQLLDAPRPAIDDELGVEVAIGLKSVE